MTTDAMIQDLVFSQNNLASLLGGISHMRNCRPCANITSLLGPLLHGQFAANELHIHSTLRSGHAGPLYHQTPFAERDMGPGHRLRVRCSDSPASHESERHRHSCHASMIDIAYLCPTSGCAWCTARYGPALYERGNLREGFPKILNASSTQSVLI